MDMICERARAKVNLTLHVPGRRDDGFHEIDSLIVFAENAFDTVTLMPGLPASVSLTGSTANKIAGENIVTKALKLLSERAPQLTLGAVQVEKHLPVAAGIGGGSADTGALLRAVSTANKDVVSSVDWLAIAKDLGADVPVCFANEACRVTGLGEKLEPVPRLPSLSAVLVNPQEAVPTNKTAQVFKEFSAGPLASTYQRAETAFPTEPSSFIEMISRTGNDLEIPAREVMPAVASVLVALRQTRGCKLAAMSGAGPTCFGLFDDPKSAAAELAAAHPHWWIMPTDLC